MAVYIDNRPQISNNKTNQSDLKLKLTRNTGFYE
jgi:hypothetical protein